MAEFEDLVKVDAFVRRAILFGSPEEPEVCVGQLRNSPPKITNCVKIFIRVTVRKPEIRKPETEKLLARLWSFTLASTIIPVCYVTSTLLYIIFVFASYSRMGTCTETRPGKRVCNVPAFGFSAVW
jgi:hypothetical protein